MEEAARVRRDRLEMPPLRLGVECAKGERRLAGAGDAGEDDESVARDLDVDTVDTRSTQRWVRFDALGASVSGHSFARAE